MSGHCGNIQQILKTGKESSTLAKHFSQRSHWPNLPPNVAPTPYQIRQKLNFEILYQGNPMTVVRHFGTVNCRICMREKLEILRHSFDPDVNLINSRSEIHGSCRHQPRFHRFSADDSVEDEKVRQRKSKSTRNRQKSGSRYDLTHVYHEPVTDSGYTLTDFQLCVAIDV